MKKCKVFKRWGKTLLHPKAEGFAPRPPTFWTPRTLPN